jgi:hypothetical protein
MMHPTCANERQPLEKRLAGSTAALGQKRTTTGSNRTSALLSSADLECDSRFFGGARSALIAFACFAFFWRSLRESNPSFKIENLAS